MSELTKRTSTGGLTKRRGAKSSRKSVDLDVKSVSVNSSATGGFDDVAQVAVAKSEEQANQLATLEVTAFANQMQRNAPVVATSKAQVAMEILGIMGDAWSDAMQIEDGEQEVDSAVDQSPAVTEGE